MNTHAKNEEEDYETDWTSWLNKEQKEFIRNIYKSKTIFGVYYYVVRDYLEKMEWKKKLYKYSVELFESFALVIRSMFSFLLSVLSLVVIVFLPLIQLVRAVFGAVEIYMNRDRLKIKFRRVLEEG